MLILMYSEFRKREDMAEPREHTRTDERLASGCRYMGIRRLHTHWCYRPCVRVSVCQMSTKAVRNDGLLQPPRWYLDAILYGPGYTLAPHGRYKWAEDLTYSSLRLGTVD